MMWRLPQGSRAAQRAVGNALCVAQSRAIVQAAISIHEVTPLPAAPPPSHTTPPVPLAPSSSADALSRDVRQLRKRTRTLEAMVSNLQTALQLSMARTAAGRPGSPPSSDSSAA